MTEMQLKAELLRLGSKPGVIVEYEQMKQVKIRQRLLEKVKQEIGTPNDKLTAADSHEV